MEKLTYIQCGDYLIPDIPLDQPTTPLEKYGEMRRDYLEKHRPVLWNGLLTTGKLFEHLLEIDRLAEQRYETMMPLLKQQLGVTEELKRQDQMKWVRMMNSIHHQIEESILTELVYS